MSREKTIVSKIVSFPLWYRILIFFGVLYLVIPALYEPNIRLGNYDVLIASGYRCCVQVSWQPLTAIKSDGGRLGWPCFRVIAWPGNTSGIVVLLLLSFLCLPPPPPTHLSTHKHTHAQCVHVAHPYPQWVPVCLLRCLLARCSDELLCRL